MNTKIIASVENAHLKKDLPEFKVGYTLKLGLKVVDTNAKEGFRIQYYEGLLIRESGSGLRKTITVRKIGANGIGVEKTIPLHNPILMSVEVLKKGKVRRARLYYLRDRLGKTALSVKSVGVK